MGRHKDTYSAKLNEQRRVTLDDQGRVHIALQIQSGDRGRPIDFCITDEKLDELTRTVREARRQQAVEQTRREERQRTSEMQQRIWELERREKDLQRKAEMLEAVIERVQEVVSPNRASDVDSSQQPDLTRLPNVTH